MDVKKLKITNRDQFSTLGDFMEKNPAVARGVKYCELQKMTRDKYNELWSDLATSLNSQGPPRRTVAEWQKVWADIKRKAKEKLAHNKKECHATGGGPNTQKTLSSIEELAASILVLDHAVSPSGPTFGLASPGRSGSSLMERDAEMVSVTSEPEEEEEEAEASGTNHRPSESPVTPLHSRLSRPVRPRNTEAVSRMEHISRQTEILKEIRQNTADIAGYTRKRFELEQEIFEYNKKKDETELKRKAQELEYKLALIECKKQKLELMSQMAREARD